MIDLKPMGVLKKIKLGCHDTYKLINLHHQQFYNFAKSGYMQVS